MKLNLGCGARKLDGYVNVDWMETTSPDVRVDLNAFPYPFETSSCDEIVASHILEHLEGPFQVMRELHRILKPGGKLLIRVPHFSRGFTHPEHKCGFDVTFPKYFDPTFTASGYIGVTYTLKEMKLRWFALPHLAGHYGVPAVVVKAAEIVSAVVSAVANASPLVCSRIWCFWVGGFDEITYDLRCIK